MDFAENSTTMANVLIFLVFYNVFEEPCEAHLRLSCHQGAILPPPENPFGRETQCFLIILSHFADRAYVSIFTLSRCVSIQIDFHCTQIELLLRKLDFCMSSLLNF